MTSPIPPAGPSDLGPFEALGRIARIFYSPREAAREIRERPNWVFPLLFSMLLSFVIAAALIGRPEWQQALQKAVESSGQKLGDLEKVKLVSAMRVVSWLGFLAAPVVGNLFIAVLLWGTAVMMEGQAGFVPVFSYQLHAQMVTLIPQTVGLGWVLARRGADPGGVENLLPFSVGYFLPSDGVAPALRAVAGSLDFFSLWYWALVVIGLAVVAGVPRRRLLLPAAFLWALGVLVRAAATLLSSGA